MKRENKLKIIYILTTIIFVISYILIAFYNRYTKDDFNFLIHSFDKSALENVIELYYNWEGAVGAHFFIYGLLSFLNTLDSPFIFNLLSLFLLLTGISILLKNTLKIKFFTALILSGFIAMDMYYNDLIISEVWFWMNGNLVYIAILGLLFMGIGLLQSTKYYWIGIFIFLFAGSMRLNFSAILLTIFGLVFIYKIIRKEKITWRFYLPFFLLLAGTFIYIAAPGNYVRKSHYEISYRIPDIISGVLLMSGDYLYRYLLVKFPYHLVFLFPVSYLLFSIKDKYPLIKNLLTGRNIILFILFAFLAVGVQNFIMYMARGYITPRTLTMVSFVFSTTIAFSFAFLMDKIPFRLSKYMVYLSLFAAAFLLIRRTYLNFDVVRTYAKAYDERTAILLDYKQNYNTNPIDTLFLDPLPPSGWLHASEVYPLNDARGYSNKNIEIYYKLPFVIYSKGDNTNKQK